MHALALIPWLGAALPAEAGEGGSWTGRTPVGELRPVTTAVRLVREDLDIRLVDLDHFEVRATYQVHNPGPPEVIRFAVPVTSGGRGGAQVGSEEAASVRVLSAAGVFVPCLVSEGERFELPVPSAVGANVVDRWCTSDLTIPEGSSEFRMSFEGQLWREATGGPEALAAGGVDRRLTYALFPAAGWSKRPDDVAITVDLGPFADRATANGPPKPVRDGRFLTWTLEKPDFQSVRWIDVALRAADRDLHDRVARQNREPTWARPSSARTSGDAPGRSAAAMLDGDPATAWCAASSPAWVELVWEKPARPAGDRCAVAWLVAAGDGASAEAFAASARPAKAEIGPCGAPGAGLAVPGGPTADTSGGAVLLPDAVKAAWLQAMSGAGPACVRVAFPAGPAPCLSETSFLAECR